MKDFLTVLSCLALLIAMVFGAGYAFVLGARSATKSEGCYKVVAKADNVVHTQEVECIP